MATSFLWKVRQILRDYPEGSYRTRAQRRAMLSQIAAEMKALGYKRVTLGNFRKKHVDALIKHWEFKAINCATVKNRLSAIRWVLRKAGRPNAIPQSNRALGVRNRDYVPKQSKAIALTDKAGQSIRYPEVRISLKLQAAFGLRREESLKFRPMMANRGTHLWLQGSWCKGGRPRAIPIRTEYQRQVLCEARELAGRGSMIPAHLSYRAHQYRFDSEIRRVGLNGSHGLRHAYAQWRYQELTGWRCPLQNGPSQSELTRMQREMDREARLVIAEELGHGRPQVITAYLGR